MLTARIIPCLDVSHGRVVKGIRFQGLRDAGDPAERAVLYERQGADEIVILDVSATPEARGNQVETVQRVRARLRIPLTVGGGIRTIDDARALLEAGADKVSVNTAAVHRPGAAERDRPALRPPVHRAGDRRRAPRSGGFEVLVKGGREGTGIDALEWARAGTGRGAGEILLTSWDRDGTRAGYDLELTRAVAAAVRVPVIASGGAATPGAPEGSVRCRRRRGARRLDLPRRRHDGRRRQARARGARRARAAMIVQRRAGCFCHSRPSCSCSRGGRALVVLVVRRVDEGSGAARARIESTAVRINSLLTSGAYDVRYPMVHGILGIRSPPPEPPAGSPTVAWTSRRKR